MKANELRIGNWIEYCNVGYKQIELFDLTQIFNGEDRLDIYAPIPLTEEILLKCGFIKDGDNYMKLILEEYCNLFFDLKHKTIAIGVPYEAGGTEFSYESLHQLQNLYFALTGEELTFKE